MDNIMLPKIVEDSLFAIRDAYLDLPWIWRFYIKWTFACIATVVCLILYCYAALCIYADWKALEAELFISGWSYRTIERLLRVFIFVTSTEVLWRICSLCTPIIKEFPLEFSYYLYHQNYLYRSPVPPHVYQLNFHYNNIYECNICLDPFNKITYGNESILGCGHRFHTSCIADWEWDILRVSYDPWNTLCGCPTCRQLYSWNQKWDYMYTIQR